MVRRARLALAALVVTASVAAAECPLPATIEFLHPSSRGIGAGFGFNVHPLLQIRKNHPGLDYDGPVGDEIRAAADGTVSAVGYDGPSGFGNLVVIEHGNGRLSRYAHLQSFGAVKAGDCVKAGRVIGKMGNSGLSATPHLHFEVHIDGVAVDPMTVLPAR